MECGLQWKDITCWEDASRLTLTHEETLETAIADYCPDMGRVVETAGQLCLRSIVPQGDGVELRGTIQVTVLYTSEESVGLRNLTQSVPFTCWGESRPLAACQVLWAEGRLLLCEAQALTPRRLSLRIMPEWTVCGYRCGTRRLCVGADDDPFLRLRRQERELCLTVSMAERECSVTGEAAVPPGQPAPEDLLLWRLYPQVGSCQLVGNKMLVKGDVTLSALYRCQQQKLHTYTAVLPFSQIVESPSGGEEGEVTVCPQLLCGEARLLRGEESSGFAVSAELRLLVRITRRETVACVTDLYSIRCAVQPDTEPVSLPPAQERPTRQEAAAHLDFGRQRPFVYVTDVSCAPAAAEDGTPCAAVRMQLLYLDETEAPAVTERTAQLPLRDGETCTRCGAPEVAFTGTGCDLRQAVSVTPAAGEPVVLTTVTAVQTVPEREEGRRPSLVMRRLAADETLWDAAKQYRTDEELIRAVNQLAEGEVPDKMLLIPRMRP